MICIVAAPEGIALVERHHPDVHIYTPVVDQGLNDHKFIVPGLGDFGDRLVRNLVRPMKTLTDETPSAEDERRRSDGRESDGVAHGAHLHRAEQDPRARLPARRDDGPAVVRRGDLSAAHGRDAVTGDRRLMEALLVSFIDHGATPPSTLAARNTATTGAPLRACVAAGDPRLRARITAATSSRCMHFLDTGLALVRSGTSYREAADADRRAVPEATREMPPGFGHRFHTRDPRAARLFQMALELEVEGEHVQMIRAVETGRSTTAHDERGRRCRSTSTAPSRRSAATSAFRRQSPTRCSSFRACPASPPTRARRASATTRCGRSTPRTTSTMARPSGGCRSGRK